MQASKTRFTWQNIFVAASSASLLMYLPPPADAQGIGPPQGTEVLLWIFAAVAAFFVLVLSTVLFLLGKRVFFKDRKASRLEKLALFTASILTSCAAGLVVMIVLDIR